MRTSSFGVLISLGLAVLAVGCGSNASTMNPARPTSVTTPAATGGATVRGTVQTSGAVAASSGGNFANVGSGIRVTVTGTSLATSTDGAGSFVLDNVPSGRIRLRFEGQGIDAQLELEGLNDGQTLTIRVRLSSDAAFVAEMEDHRNEVEFLGAIEAITGSTLLIQGRTIHTDGLTEFRGRDNNTLRLNDLGIGTVVEVEGAIQSDGSIYAREVKVEDRDLDGMPEIEVRFVGAVASLNPFRVDARAVVIDSGTRILDNRNNPISFATLKIGDSVEVEGSSRSDGTVLAKKIKIED